MKTIIVRVIDSSGSPAQKERVWVHIYHPHASRSKDQCANNLGEARFNLNIDSGAEISVSVRGTQFVSRAPVQSRYQI